LSLSRSCGMQFEVFSFVPPFGKSPMFMPNVFP
jgi:hypothetical protein